MSYAESVADEAPNAEEMMMQREEASEKTTVRESVKRYVKEIRTDIKEWITSQQQGGRTDALDYLENYIRNNKELDLSQLPTDVAEFIKKTTDPKFLIDTINKAITDENRLTIKRKIESNKEQLTRMYGEKGYKQIHWQTYP